MEILRKLRSPKVSPQEMDVPTKDPWTLLADQTDDTEPEKIYFSPDIATQHSIDDGKDFFIKADTDTYHACKNSIMGDGTLRVVEFRQFFDIAEIFGRNVYSIELSEDGIKGTRLNVKESVNGVLRKKPKVGDLQQPGGCGGR